MSGGWRYVTWGLVIFLAIAAMVVWLGPSAAFREARQTTQAPLPSAVPAGVAPLRVTGGELIERAKELDGQWVQFQGEAIGDRMVRGDVAWVNVADSQYAIGVLMSRQNAEAIRVLGDYDWTGDIVLVTGIFRRADTDWSEDLDIAAAEVTVVEAGETRPQPLPSRERIQLALVLAGLAGAMAFLARVFRTRPHEGA